MRKVEIPKSSGGKRTIYVQDPRSKHKFAALAKELTAECQRLAPPGVVRGFMPGESPVTNARAHASAKYVLNMDLADFFDHCTAPRIAAGLMDFMPVAWQPAGAQKKADALAARAVYDGAARQGLSCSPAAANCAALPLDRDILAALPNGVTYTRYADDLTFSAEDPALLKTVRQQVPAIAKTHGQEVKASKTRMQAATAGRMVITGVAVAGGKLYATRAVRRRSRAAAHNCKKFVLQIGALARAGQFLGAAILWRANWRQFSRARGLADWCRL